MLSRCAASCCEIRFATMFGRELGRCVPVQGFVGPLAKTWTAKRAANIGLVQAVQVVQAFFNLMRMSLPTDKAIAGECITPSAMRQCMELRPKFPAQLDHLDQANKIRLSRRSRLAVGSGGGWPTWTTPQAGPLRHWLQCRAAGRFDAERSAISDCQP